MTEDMIREYRMTVKGMEEGNKEESINQTYKLVHNGNEYVGFTGDQVKESSQLKTLTHH